MQKIDLHIEKLKVKSLPEFSDNYFNPSKDFSDRNVSRVGYYIQYIEHENDMKMLLGSTMNFELTLIYFRQKCDLQANLWLPRKRT